VAPDAGRHQGGNPGAGPEQLVDDHHDVAGEDSPGGYDCELLDLVERLGDRVLDLEHRLAAADVPHVDLGLIGRAKLRRRAAGSSPTLTYAAGRERVCGGRR
jgi:hypothetical protein